MMRYGHNSPKQQKLSNKFSLDLKQINSKLVDEVCRLRAEVRQLRLKNSKIMKELLQCDRLYTSEEKKVVTHQLGKLEQQQEQEQLKFKIDQLKKVQIQPQTKKQQFFSSPKREERNKNNVKRINVDFSSSKEEDTTIKDLKKPIEDNSSYDYIGFTENEYFKSPEPKQQKVGVLKSPLTEEKYCSPVMERVSEKLERDIMAERASIDGSDKEISKADEDTEKKIPSRSSRRLAGSDSLVSYKELSLKVKMTKSFFVKLKSK